jgi:alcohol-forming fatty acyl-CoA reductase
MSSVENFFEGKSVFITGGTGFVGKVLVEKLLRTFGGLKNVFVLIRSKRNGRDFLNFR